MAVILVWEEVPESTKFYRLDGPNADAALRAHNCFINVKNGDPEDAAEVLCAILEFMEPLDLDAGPIDVAAGDKIVRAGMMLMAE